MSDISDYVEIRLDGYCPECTASDPKLVYDEDWDKILCDTCMCPIFFDLNESNKLIAKIKGGL